MGHQAGLKAAKEVVRAAGEAGVEILTLFAFSSENWKRPPAEVKRLMDLFLKALKREMDELDRNDVKLRFIGDRTRLSAELRTSMDVVERRTESNTGMQLVIAINYGGRWDVAQAAQRIARAAIAGEISPDQIDEDTVINAIDPAKDVNGFHVVNAGKLATGQEALVPCTPLGCIMLLKDELGDLSGLEAVVVGRSNIVGKPMAQLLLAESCTVTIAHSRTRDIASIVHRADIVVAAVGRAEMVKGEWIKPGATVIDVGINRVADTEDGKSRIVGDVATAEALAHVRAITPVPGGVGPMTIAVLLRNTLVAAHARAGLAKPDGL